MFGVLPIYVRVSYFRGACVEDYNTTSHTKTPSLGIPSPILRNYQNYIAVDDDKAPR